MLKKTRSGESGRMKVTFVLPPQPNANHVHLAGDFNDWQSSNPMKRQKDGSWRTTVELDAGREYHFRYLVDGDHWVNDEAADAYVPNPFGADNCVVRLESAPAAERESTSTKSRPSAGGRSSSRGSGTGKVKGSGTIKPAGGGRSSGGKGASSRNGSGRASGDKTSSRTTGMAAKGRDGEGSSRGGSRGSEPGSDGG